MQYLNHRSMQKHTLQASLLSSPCQLPVQREIPVFIVTCYRKAQMSQVNANLMSTAGFQFRLQQAEVVPCFFEGENSVSGHAILFSTPACHGNASFPGSCYIFVERQF